MDNQIFYLYLAGVPLLGVSAQWLAWRFQLPSILLLLAFGVTLGVFVTPDELLAELIQGERSSVPQFLFPIVSFCVAIILFEGGLTLKLSELKEAGSVVFRLVTVGVLVSWLLGAGAAAAVVGLDVRMAVLLGAILTVTGPTVIAPLLRHIRPTRKIGAIVSPGLSSDRARRAGIGRGCGSRAGPHDCDWADFWIGRGLAAGPIG